MENELMIVNKNELELTKEGIQFIKKLQKAKVEVEKMEEQLKDMFLKSKEYNDEIDFTVYGDRIIPEDKVLNKLLSSTSTGNPNYRADIDYFDKLVKDEKSLVKTVEEAEDVIAGIPVYIKASLAI